ncbi:MAG: hypothetical protein ABSH05_21595 [Bryobacteraceae bacterium]
MKAEKPQSGFLLCIRSEGSDDLDPRKVYQVLPDRAAVREGYVRVIDESGEDYLYPADYFAPISDDAPLCSECGSIMTQNGSCFKCANCGGTSGCN